MSELKRPERYVQPESIKPKLSSITDFYTQKVNEYWNRIKQLNEYADALENEISVLKETPKVEVLLDNIPKDLPEVPQFVAEYIIRCKSYGSGLIWSIRPDRDANELCRLTYDWLFPNGCRLEDGSFPDPFEPDNLVRPDSDNQLKFARAWLDGYTVEKEQLYEVVFYVDEEDDRCLLMKTGKTILFEFESQNEGHYKQQFTESEIKAIDERYWAFAVPVDEV